MKYQLWLTLFSCGFALTRLCFGVVEPAAIVEPKRKLRLKIRSASVTPDSPLSPITIVCFVGCNFVVHVSYVHEPFSGTPW